MGLNSEILAIKIIFIVSCFIITMIAGLIPMKWKRCRNNERALGLANTFSGGVFLAIAFIHLIPETAALYYEYKYNTHINPSPGGGTSNSTNTTTHFIY